MQKTRYHRTTKEGKRIVKIGFRTPKATDTSFFNRAASWITNTGTGRIYSHVEMRFSDGVVTSITETTNKIHYDDTRVLSAIEYKSFFEIHISPEQEEVMQIYAKKMADAEVPFNKWGMMLNFLPCCFFSCCAVRKQGRAYFCSEYITDLLQLIQYVPELDASRTSPNALHAALLARVGKDVYRSINEVNYLLHKALNKRDPNAPSLLDYAIDAPLPSENRMGRTGLRKKK